MGTDDWQSKRVAGSGWFILRMKGPSTLRLSTSLADAGYEVWTPIYIQTKRVPRSKAKVQRPVPFMPTYVFARAQHLLDLLDIAADPTKDHADFSVFRCSNRIPIISDADLQTLRAAEARAAHKHLKTQRATKPIPVGETRRIPSGPFAGMSGVVEQSDGRHTLVCFNGKMRVRVSTLLLTPDELDLSRPITGAAA